MKSGSVSFAVAEPQSEPQNGSTLSTIFDQHLLATACGCSLDIILVARSVLHSRLNLILSPFFGLRILFLSRRFC